MSKRQIYFLKQKLMGLAMLVITALLTFMVDGGVIAGVVTLPVGLMMLFSKKMILTNSYYFEVKQAKEKKGS